MRYDIIKTEKYLLISDDSEIKGYYYDEYIKKVKHSGGAEYAENNITKNIVAHLPLNGAPYLDGVPVLPQLSNHREDKDYSLSAAKEFAKSHFENLYEKYPLGGKVAIKNIMNVLEVGAECGHKFGYNKAREKYKFTEEDLRKAIKMAQEQELVRHTDSEYRMVIAYTHSEMDIIKSLQQPKYPIAFECEVEPEYKHIGAVKEVKGSGDKIRNKNAGKTKTIINPDGRVVWVGKYIYE
jgi:hypothetical protein